MDHLDQARRNYRAFTLLRDSDFVDWATTVLFYTAMQVVEAWLLTRVGTESGSHAARASRMFRLGVPASVFSAYDRLRQMSELARYRDWTAALDAERLAQLHDDAYRQVREHFDAPDGIRPD